MHKKLEMNIETDGNVRPNVPETPGTFRFLPEEWMVGAGVGFYFRSGVDEICSTGLQCKNATRNIKE